MSTTPGSPLTEEHLNQMNNALDVATRAQQQIDTAKRAGIDVSQLEAQLKDSVDKIRQVKSVYFPGR